jgi:type IV secretion system protein VirB6
MKYSFLYSSIRSWSASLLLLFIFSLPSKVLADDNFPWMSASLTGLSNLFSQCLEVPEFINYSTGSKALDVSSSGTWVSTGNQVQSGKLVQINWSTKGLEARPRKYLILYRVDPRFPQPQVFIQSYDYKLGQYVSDFHQFKNQQLVSYQTNPSTSFSQRIIDYSNYFSFAGRSQVPIYNGDVINITLASSSDFFSSTAFPNDLDHPSSSIAIAYTISPTLDNQLIYSAASVWCSAISSSSVSSSMKCNNGQYKSGSISDLLIGKLYEPKFNDIRSSLNPCTSGLNTKDLSTLCFYDKGRGMKIGVNGKPIKATAESFLHSDFTNKDFIYYKANSSGALQITTDWDIGGMFDNFNQFMNSWGVYNDVGTLNSMINNSTINLSANFLHFGRYFMSLEIGNGDQSISTEEQEAIQVEYIISNNPPTSSTPGTKIDQNARFDAPSSGYLWLRVINPNSQVQGAITAYYANYTGTTIFSDIVYNKLITPLRKQFNDLTKFIYSKLITNPTLQRAAKLMLTLYIVFYGLFFLAGATQITVSDIVSRVIKISLVVALFSQSSWDFFNNNVFQVFVSGTDYLMTRIVGITSSSSNVFGFIDPIFDKYTNGRIWGLLFIQLFQIHNGLAFFALMTIYGMILFFRSVLEVIIGYCLAFVGLAVMISLAPFFISFILFERTRSLFDNWISSLFDYMVQPTILLVFFLFIDQLIGTQLLGAVSKACWGCLVPIQVALDLRHIGIPLDFSFTLPFLPCIPFYITSIHEPSTIGEVFGTNGTFLMVASSSILFYSYCLMAYGLVQYVTDVTSQLTNVIPARQEGVLQRHDNATESVIGDIKSITTDPIESAGRVFKDKVIDQNYRARPSGKRDQE